MSTGSKTIKQVLVFGIPCHVHGYALQVYTLQNFKLVPVHVLGTCFFAYMFMGIWKNCLYRCPEVLKNLYLNIHRYSSLQTSP